LVSLCNGDSYVIDWKSPFPEEVFAHVREGGRRVNGVPAHPVPLQIRSCVPALKVNKFARRRLSFEKYLKTTTHYSRDDDSCDADAHFRALEQFVPEVDAIPEGHKVPLDLHVVSAVKPEIFS